MNNYISLSEFFDNTRPQIKDLYCIYSALVSCIEKGMYDKVIMHMEYILYDRYSGSVKFTADRHIEENKDKNVVKLLKDIRVSVKYADEQTIQFSDRFNRIYINKGYLKSKEMLEEYKEKLNNSRKIITGANFIFISVVILVIIVYCKLYGVFFV